MRDLGTRGTWPLLAAELRTAPSGNLAYSTGSKAGRRHCLMPRKSRLSWIDIEEILRRAIYLADEDDF